MGKFIDLSSKRFGRLIVLGKNPNKIKKCIFWDCICDCGNNALVKGESLRNNTTRSCGCLGRECLEKHRKTHAMSHTKVYIAWGNMKTRCYNPKNLRYDNYAGREIVVHETFLNDFTAFYEEVGDPPDDTRKWSIDRIDNTKDYEPGNLRWATNPEQARNRGKRRNNSSGITGVSFAKSGNNYYWMARWTNIDGKEVSKCFNISTYGDEEAKRLATVVRQDAIEKLNENGAGYSENHGQ